MTTGKFLGLGARTVQVPKGAFMPVRGAVFLDVADKDVPAVVEARTGQ